MNKQTENSEIIEYLSSFVTERRMEKINSVLDNRTKYITVLLEDLFQPHNASAVLRSCDGFGIQDVHIIESRNRFKPSKTVAMGSAQWLNLHRYGKETGSGNASMEAINALRSKGYRIVATTPHTDDIELENFDLSRGKTAIVLGTELEGLSDDVMNNADEFLKIPMFGFVESFNISVACALILHHLTWKLRTSELDWRLEEQEREQTLLSWLRATVKNADRLEKHFLQQLD